MSDQILQFGIKDPEDVSMFIETNPKEMWDFISK
jgi:hypothetical protein